MEIAPIRETRGRKASKAPDNLKYPEVGGLKKMWELAVHDYIRGSSNFRGSTK